MRDSILAGDVRGTGGIYSSSAVSQMGATNRVGTRPFILPVLLEMGLNENKEAPLSSLSLELFTLSSITRDSDFSE